MQPAARHHCCCCVSICRTFSGGITLRSIIGQIETKIAVNTDLVLKLHEVVATTLGASLNESLALTFDMKLAVSSLRFFSLSEVPAIREPLPAGVSDVHFRSDLSAQVPLSIQYLIDKDPSFWDLLPRAKEARMNMAERRPTGTMITEFLPDNCMAIMTGIKRVN